MINYTLLIYKFSFLKATLPYLTRMEQNIQANKNHCKYCFDVLISKLNNKPVPEFPENWSDWEVPLFVTWKKNDQLRGCIGTFSAGKLSKVLGSYALTSSMKDRRFRPIAIQQLKQLSVSVSLLVNFRQNQGLYNWQIGKHGIIIQAQHEGQQYHGTFLPQVAKQQGWNQKQTLQHLLQKAQFYGKLSQIQSKIKLTTYQSSKCKMSYQQYSKLSELK